MKRNEEFSFLKGTWKQLKKINSKVNRIIEGLDTNKLYAINYSNLKQRFAEELENYKNHPELIDIEEFSANYAFGYHSSNNIDSMCSKQAMFIEVKSYLNNIKNRA
ncbi:hypothetical protein [Aquimarina litoralis]|uniref:hypothetical protein n=1 Tax=Aquimarina litoralis TaxID=584605 RepID=UPI001C598FA2|nr:hypothetical protein [Aquimarina litoralis]MBW1298522.1 hypothetical protein [Aquimarina litoralis]